MERHRVAHHIKTSMDGAVTVMQTTDAVVTNLHLQTAEAVPRATSTTDVDVVKEHQTVMAVATAR